MKINQTRANEDIARIVLPTDRGDSQWITETASSVVGSHDDLFLCDITADGARSSIIGSFPHRSTARPARLREHNPLM
jgi:hypothetical protein